MPEKFPTQDAEELASLYADEQFHADQAEAAAQEQRLEEWFDRSQQNGQDNRDYLAARPAAETDVEARDNILNGLRPVPQPGEEAPAHDLSQFDALSSAQIAQKLANANFKQETERSDLLSEALAAKVKTELTDSKQAAIEELLADPNHRQADLKALEQMDDDESVRKGTEELFAYSNQFRDVIAAKDARDKAKATNGEATPQTAAEQTADTQTKVEPEQASAEETPEDTAETSNAEADESQETVDKTESADVQPETKTKADKTAAPKTVKPAAPKKKTTLDKRAAASIASTKFDADEQRRRVRLGKLGPLPEQAKPKQKEAPFKPLTRDEFKYLSKDEQKDYKAREKVAIEKMQRAQAHADYRQSKHNVNQEIAKLDTFIEKGAAAELTERREKSKPAAKPVEKQPKVEQAETEAEQAETKQRLKRTRRAAKWLIRGWVDTDKKDKSDTAQTGPENTQPATNEVLKKLYLGEDDAEAAAEDDKVAAEKKAREDRKAAQAAKLGTAALASAGAKTATVRSNIDGKFDAKGKDAADLERASS